MSRRKLVFRFVILISLLLSFTLVNHLSTQQQNSSIDNISISSCTDDIPWRRTWGSNESDWGRAVAVSGDAIYCLGFSGLNMTLVKFWSNGLTSWNRVWGGNFSDSGWNVAVDAAGDIYCAGTTYSYGVGLSDFVLVKYNIDGSFAWNETWGGAANEERPDVAVDVNGSIICTGTTGSFNSVTELYLLKYYPNRTLEWSRCWGESWSINSRSVVTDNAGNIYCTGLTRNGSTPQGNQEMLLVKFYPNNTFAWSQKWGTYDSEYGFAIDLDSNGNIYCLGFTDSPTLTGDLQDYIALVKFTPNGTYLWNYTWGSNSRQSLGMDVTIDANNTIYCIGYTRDPLTSDADFVLLKIFPNKTLVGSATWGCDGDDVGNGIALGHNETIFCVGWTTSFGNGSYDFALIKFRGLLGPLEICPSGSNPIPGYFSLYVIYGMVIPIFLFCHKRKRRYLLGFG